MKQRRAGVTRGHWVGEGVSQAEAEYPVGGWGALRVNEQRAGRTLRPK